MAEQSGEIDEEVKRFAHYSYPNMTKTQGNFTLTVEEGGFTDSEIIVMLGENGTGKTTFIRLLGGLLQPDDTSIEIPEFRVSYKPQKISPKFPGSVRRAFSPSLPRPFVPRSFSLCAFRCLVRMVTCMHVCVRARVCGCV